MQNSFFYVFLILIVLNSSCAIQKRIVYSFTANKETSSIINNAPNELNKHLPKNYKKRKLYVFLFETPNNVNLSFYNYSNIPKNLKRLIKNSSRFIQVGNKKIPVIFEIDGKSNILTDKDGGRTPIPFVGYLITIDNLNQQNVLFAGIGI